MKYLINKETKEHIVYKPCHDYLNSVVWRVVQADDDGWIPHTGTVCPLPEDAKCDYRTGVGFEVKNRLAKSIAWHALANHYDITHYRPILTEKAQEPEPVPAKLTTNTLDLLGTLKRAHEHAQTIPDLEAELRELLGSMGYDLVARSPFVEPEPAVETPQDMTDWRNWREGDVLECSQPDVSFLFEGELATIEFINEYGDIFIEENSHGYRPQNFRFHSRPAQQRHGAEGDK